MVSLQAHLPTILILVICGLAMRFLPMPISAKTVDRPRKWCGGQLADVLQRLCIQGFLGMKKRSESFPVGKSMHGVLTRHYKRGVVDDCCIKSCTIGELQQYCAGDPVYSEAVAKEIYEEFHKPSFDSTLSHTSAKHQTQAERVGQAPNEHGSDFFFVPVGKRSSGLQLWR